MKTEKWQLRVTKEVKKDPHKYVSKYKIVKMEKGIGKRWQKMTRIITNLGKFWTPRCEKKARWTRKCPHCTACRKGIAHDMFIVRRGKHDKRPAAKLEGFNKKASKNRIPPEMAEEWAKAAMARRLAAQEETM